MKASPTGLKDSVRWGRVFGAGIWLIFLADTFGALIKRDGDWQGDVGLLALALFVVVYLHGLARIPTFHWPGRQKSVVPYLAILVVCSAGVIIGAGGHGLTCLVFVAALGTAALPKYWALGWVAVLFTTVELSGRFIDGWATHGNDFAILLASAATYSFRLAMQRQASLRAAELDLSELAVEEERNRIARDLHDILGHSLTVISVKAELAERLFESDPERAHAELEDLRRLSRDALADVRSTAQGLRGISLPGEIASARMALESAGIRPQLPTVADEVPSRWRELFAWTLREGVTNVIRHSQASFCEVKFDASGIRIVDDGCGTNDQVIAGHGLDGLRQRTVLAGATLTTGPGVDGNGFVLAVGVGG